MANCTSLLLLLLLLLLLHVASFNKAFGVASFNQAFGVASIDKVFRGPLLREGKSLGGGKSISSFGCKLTVDKEECQLVFDVNGAHIWSSDATVTYGATDCQLKMQDDGDLVLESASRGRIWHSNTGFGGISGSFYALEVSCSMLLARIVRLTDDDYEYELQEIWTTSFTPSG